MLLHALELSEVGEIKAVERLGFWIEKIGLVEQFPADLIDNAEQGEQKGFFESGKLILQCLTEHD